MVWHTRSASVLFVAHLILGCEHALGGEELVQLQLIAQEQDLQQGQVGDTKA